MKSDTLEKLSAKQVRSGLTLVVKDGLAAEAMATLTGGAFLIAMALNMGASNFQIGVLAALPTIANIFQLTAVWLVQKYNNRRVISVICSIIARSPLFVIGLLPIVMKNGTSVQMLIILIFFHYLFGSIVGAVWNSWMKDLVPEKMLGSYFSHRSRLIQILNVTLSLVIAVMLDHVKSHYPHYENTAYSIMFIVGGAFGMLGVYLLSRTPEPRAPLLQENIFLLLRKPLQNKNFRKFLLFNSFWAFSLNIATPFITIFLLKTVHLPLSYVIGLGIASQFSSILSIRAWGKYSDRFSNKTVIRICAPVYAVCIFAWTLTENFVSPLSSIFFLLLISIGSGISTAGVNLAMSNISLKMAPKEDAIVYISARNMITSLFPAIAPVLGGLMADFFASHSLSWSMQWTTPSGNSMVHLLELQHWSFFFFIGAVLAMISLRLLKDVTEEGEIKREVMVSTMMHQFKSAIGYKTGHRA
ncbi:MAG: MFS transporter [Chitinophagaceae bacterium]